MRIRVHIPEQPTRFRSVVLLRGVIRGMGCESACELVAIRERDLETRRNYYSRCSVIRAAANLPDGDYTVTLSDGTVAVRRQGGLWLPDGTQLGSAA